MPDATPINHATRLQIHGLRTRLHLLFCHDVTIYQTITPGTEEGGKVSIDTRWQFRAKWHAWGDALRAMQTPPAGEAKS